jgi:hypothetical protein
VTMASMVTREKIVAKLMPTIVPACSARRTTLRFHA